MSKNYTSEFQLLKLLSRKRKQNTEKYMQCLTIPASMYVYILCDLHDRNRHYYQEKMKTEGQAI